jgi:hypothetical protein
MDLNELLNSGRVSMGQLVQEIGLKVVMLEAQQATIISQLTQIIANQENRDFDEVAEKVMANHQVHRDKAYKQFLEMLARNVQ